IPGGGADVFEDDVNATFGGEAADFVFNFLGFVIDEFVSAQFFCFGQLGFVASGSYDATAEQFGDLNGGRAYTATRAEDEDFFGGLKLRAGEQHVPGGLENERNGGGFFEREIFGIGEAVDL